MLTEYRRL